MAREEAGVAGKGWIKKGLSRAGILFYRLCFEIMDYLFVQNVFVIVKMHLITK